jgi:hypothetical protein
MNIKISLLTVILILGVSVFGQSLAEKAESDPLDLAYFMVNSQNSPEYNTEEIQDIALKYFRSDRKSDAVLVLEQMENVDYKTMSYEVITHWLIRDRKFKEAEIYLLKASETNRNNKYGLDIEDSQEIASKWILLNNEKRALEEANFYENEVVKASILNSIADTYTENGNPKKALQFLLQADKFLENAELDEFDTLTKARIAKSFSELKQQDKAQKLISEVEEIYPKVEYSTSYPKEKEIKQLIIETYLNLKQYDKAFELIEKDIDPESPNGLIKLAEINIRIGEIQKAKALLQKVSAFDDNYEKVQAVKLYLKIDEDIFALELAKSLTNNYSKFESLKVIADKFIKDKKTSEAIFVIQYILDIPFVNDKENLSYDETLTDKEDQLTFAFERYNEIKRPDLALKIIEKADDTDIKAPMLASFSYLYKNKISKKLAIEYLNQSQQILFTSKRKPTDKILLIMLMRTAVSFADFGEKEKSLEIFSYVLEKLLSEDRIYGSEPTGILTAIGINFAETKIPADKRMKTALKNLKEKWLEENK